ncbi:MAG: amidohydrolase [Luteibaculum sp.]
MDTTDLIAHRHYLHQNPELAFEENGTQAYLKKSISAWNPVAIWEIAGTGLLVQCNGEESTPGFMYRTDIDALPIQEANSHLAYRSTKQQKAHLCGHDGHASIAMGLVKHFCKNGTKEPVYVLFQPAEETGMGALKVMEDPVFKKIKFRGALAIHNLPGYELNQVLLSKKTFSASVSTLFYKFYGQYSHAAEPGKGINPAFAISDMLNWLEENNVYAPDDNFCFGTPVCVRVGEEAYGTNPGYGELHITIRAAQLKKFEKLRDKVQKMVKDFSQSYQLEYQVKELELFPSVKQDNKMLKTMEEILQDGISAFAFLDGPNRWGEDFGYFRESMPTLMIGIGSGLDQAPLHNENYNFPDEIIGPSVKLLSTFIEKANV